MTCCKICIVHWESLFTRISYITLTYEFNPLPTKKKTQELSLFIGEYKQGINQKSCPHEPVYGNPIIK